MIKMYVFKEENNIKQMLEDNNIVDYAAILNDIKKHNKLKTIEFTFQIYNNCFRYSITDRYTKESLDLSNLNPELVLFWNESIDDFINKLNYN